MEWEYLGKLINILLEGLQVSLKMQVTKILKNKRNCRKNFPGNRPI